MARNLSSLFGASTKGGLFGDISSPQDQYDTARVANDNMRAQLGMAGLPDPTEEGPGALSRVFGVLDAPATAIRATVGNMLIPGEYDVAEEAGKSLRGEERVFSAEILEKMGTSNKWAQLVGGFVVDVLLDPISYLTFGWSAGAKAAGRVALATLADDVAKGGVNIASKYGDDVAKIVSHYGSDLSRVGKKGSRELKEAVTRHSAGQLSPVDRGGIKIGLPLSSRGISIAPEAQKGISKAAYGMKDVLRKAPGSEWFESAFMHGSSSHLTPIYRQGNEVVNAALDSLQRGLVRTESMYRVMGEQWDRQLKALIPDSDIRRHVSMSIAEASGDMAQRAEFSAGVSAVKAAWDDAADAARPLLRAAGYKDPQKKFGITGKYATTLDNAIAKVGPDHEAARHYLSKRAAIDTAQESLDALRAEIITPANIDAALVRRIQDPAELAKAREAAGKAETWFAGLLQQQRGAGLEVKSLYGTPDRPSLGYLPGMSPSMVDKKETKKLAEYLLREGYDPDQLRQPGFLDRVFKGVALKDPAGAKSKEYNTLIDRLQGLTRKDLEKVAKTGDVPLDELLGPRTGIATELDLATLGKHGAETAGKRIAQKSYMDGAERIAKTLDPETGEEMLRLARKAQSTLTDDKAVAGLVNAFDYALGKWKKWATALNIPRFQHRNWGSNQALLWFEGLWDTKTMNDSFDIIGKLVKAGGRMDIGPTEAIRLAKTADFTPAQRKLVEQAVEQGVWQQAVDLMQLSGSQAAQPMGRLTAAGSAYNQVVEMQSRLAGFARAMDKGLSPEAAKIAVDKALYDYSNAAYTVFEREFMMRLVPFYRWQKNNAIHLVELMGERPGKLTAIEKLVRGSQSVEPIDTDVMPEWMRDQLPIPLPGWKSPEGDQVLSLAASTFPLAELQLLAKLIAEPTAVPFEAMQNLNPILKTPIEIIFNKNLFYGDEISPYPGATRRAPGYVQQFDKLATSVPGFDIVWGLMKDALAIREKVDDDGSSHLVINAKAHKALSDLHPWFNQMGKILDEDPGQFKRLYYLTGTRFEPYDEEKLERNQVWGMNDLLRQAVRKGRDEGTIPEPVRRSNLSGLFGGE